MNWYATKQLAVYGGLLFVGCFFLLIATGGSFGALLETFALVTGVSFVSVALYGLVQRKTYRQLPKVAKVAVWTGASALLAFVILMALIVLALRNFS